MIFPLCIQGVTSYLPVHAPTKEEWESRRYPRIDLTSDTLTWDPSCSRYEDQEEALLDHRGEFNPPEIDTSMRGPKLVINSLTSQILLEDSDTSMRGPKLVVNSLTSHHPLVDITHNDNFATVLQSKVNVSATQSGGVRSNAKKSVDAPTLARRWMIPENRARQTVQQTTQRGVRDIINPTLSRRYPTNDRWHRYPRLPHMAFTDTMFAGTRSKRGNKCAQLFATDFGWTRAYPMTSKGLAHEALSVFFKTEGVPPVMMMDNSKEQTLGDFRRKCREADCHIKTTEPHSPWMNTAETQIRETKRGMSRKMLRTQSPKKLWDHCLELETRIRSCTAHDLYKLQGEVPETLMKGSTADISQICAYDWFEWIMYLDNESFPEDKLTLGRYLGPAIDVGSAMTAKILKSNGEYICRSTFRALSSDEVASNVHAEMRTNFMLEVTEKLGSGAIASDFPVEDLTPSYDNYEDGDQDVSTSEETLEPTPEAHDNFVNANVLLPRGDTFARGRVIGRKRDIDGNTP